MGWCLGGGGWFMTGMAVLVLVAAVWTVTRLFPTTAATDPAALLDARLARGDLDLETYRALRDELAGGTEARRATPAGRST